MGLKDFFVEKVPSDDEFGMKDIRSSMPEIDDVALDEVHTDTLIDDVYAQNDLSDNSKSIFKVEDLINSLPKEMVTETKKASVLATLGVFGLTVTDVTLDGEHRIDVLNSVLSNILQDGNDTVTEKESEIEEHKKEIARLEKEIAERRDEMKTSENKINVETDRIANLIKFIEGGKE